MANKIIMKKSSVAAKIPLSTDLEVGEIAGNLEDQKLYSKKPDGTVVLMGSGLGGSGDVEGPSSATDNALARYDGTTGKTVQNSDATVDDSGNLTATTSRSTGTSANKMPVGTTPQRPATPESGEYRLNSTKGIPEWYDASASDWKPFSLGVDYSVEYLIIAGGGGGGRYDLNNGCGGGGAGGYRCSVSGESSGGGASAESAITITSGVPYDVIVGAGGSGRAFFQNGASGNNSEFADIVSIGGGGGGAQLNGVSGGSGGGAGSADGGSATGGSGTSGQGFKGGNSVSGGSFPENRGGGGGGGAGQQGQPERSDNLGGGAGGNGVSSAITGTSTTRGGGGGGGSSASRLGANGGSGGGGDGGDGGGAGVTAGSANTGGGGGGAGSNGNSASGGSGVVIIRYLGAQRANGGSVTSSGGYTIHTFTSSGTFVA